MPKREEPRKIVEKPKPVAPKPPAPKPDSSFSKTVEAHIDSIEATLSGLSHEMSVASSQWFQVDPFDDLGLTDQQSITKYLELIFWIHSKALAAHKGKIMDF